MSEREGRREWNEAQERQKRAEDIAQVVRYKARWRVGRKKVVGGGSREKGRRDGVGKQRHEERPVSQTPHPPPCLSQAA